MGAFASLGNVWPFPQRILKIESLIYISCGNDALNEFIVAHFRALDGVDFRGAVLVLPVPFVFRYSALRAELQPLVAISTKTLLITSKIENFPRRANNPSSRRVLRLAFRNAPPQALKCAVGS